MSEITSAAKGAPRIPISGRSAEAPQKEKDPERSHSGSSYHVIARITVSGPSESLLRAVALLLRGDKICCSPEVLGGFAANAMFKSNLVTKVSDVTGLS